MLQSLVQKSDLNFSDCDKMRPRMRQACADHPKVASYHHLGTSEEGRPLDAVILGNGAKRVSLMAGAHSDEPVGPETLRALILNAIEQRDRLKKLLETYQFIIIPHINPDGEVKNQRWIKKWPSVEAYLQYAFREPPGRDLEFGFANIRQENSQVSEFLIEHAPFVMHASLHGMGFSEGAMLLIERHWIERTQTLRLKFAEAAGELGLRLHDHDRKGEKGFVYIEPGFTTTPEGRAMRNYFKAKGEKETAECFHDSSMEFVRKWAGDPLCLVPELPLFVINKQVANRPAGVPEAYLAFKDQIPVLRAQLSQRHSVADALREYQITPLDLTLAVRLQLQAIQLGMEAISDD